ncbi:MAG: hypothetical protein JXO49_10140 [Deltaproteobacteria bacterium]|nr:hypothetical protein [Candidatus Anaeroferrophillus wilburensis]MBN2889692.1 hypothetical protein [Deltaproteobacteria bacterium]
MMVAWYLSLSLAAQLGISVIAFILGKVVIVALFSIIQSLFLRWFGRQRP